MIKFEKVSYEQFRKDFPETVIVENKLTEEDIKTIYNGIKLPRRATKGSAGYDFYAPYDLKFFHGKSILIPTGIRCCMNNSGTVLLLAPRSGQGFKIRMQLNNTIGVIDEDYYHALNEGHIMLKMFYDDEKTEMFTVEKGKAFVQGIFVQYFTTDEDYTEGIRLGGFGSTTK